jgi:ribosome-associated protein
MERDYLLALNTVAQTIFDKKGSNILVLDIRHCSTITDYVVIAEGNVDRHVIAIAQAIEKALSDLGMTPSFREGMQSGDWVVLDYIQIMVHIFMPGMREKYQLEKLWKEAEIVDISIDVSHEKSISAG